MPSTCIACQKAAADLETPLLWCHLCTARDDSIDPLGLCIGCFDKGASLFSVTWHEGREKSFTPPPTICCRMCLEAEAGHVSSRYASSLAMRSDSTAFAKLATSKFPWLLVLHDSTHSEKLAALRKLKFVFPAHFDDSDAGLLVASNTDVNKSLTLSLIAQAAHGADATAAQKLTASAAFDAARRQQAVHTKWRSLLAPPKGSFAAFTAYLQDRASASSDPVVRALAQERLHVARLIAAMYSTTPMSASYISSADVSSHGMTVIYAVLKHLSREIKEAATRSKPEFQVLLSLYGPTIALVDLQPSLNRLRLTKIPDRSAVSQPTKTPVVLQENKNRRATKKTTDLPKQGHTRRPRSRSPRHPQKTAPTTKLDNRGSTSTSGRPCKNCALNGMKTSHSLADCKRLGNKCALQCRICNNGKHWRVDCPTYIAPKTGSKV